MLGFHQDVYGFEMAVSRHYRESCLACLVLEEGSPSWGEESMGVARPLDSMVEVAPPLESLVGVGPNQMASPGDGLTVKGSILKSLGRRVFDVFTRELRGHNELREDCCSVC
jgi:hypothetical protein